MEIKHKDDGRRGTFYVENEGKIVGRMDYVWAGTQKIIIEHTEIDQSVRGKSIGTQLVHRAVVFAREKHMKILPLCPFAKAVFEKTTEYEDVLF